MKHLPILVLTVLCACGSPSDSSLPLVQNPEWGAWQDTGEVPFRFVLERTFGAEEEPADEVLAQITSVATDDAGNVYVLDGRANRIVKFAEDGRLLWTFGREGQGPGELRSVFSLLWDGSGRLLVGNQQGTRLDAVGADGQFVETIPITPLGLSYFRLVGMLDASRVVLGTSLFGRFGSGFHVVDIAGAPTLSSGFEVDQTGDTIVPQGISASSSAAVVDGAIVVSGIGEYALRFHDPLGNVGLVVTRAMDGLVRPGVYSSGGAASISTLSSLGSPIRIPGPYWLVTASWPTNIDDPDEFVRLRMASREDLHVTRAQAFDLYDDQWRLLYSWTLENPEPGTAPSITHADARGRVYGRTDAGFPQLGRYRVEVQAPK